MTKTSTNISPRRRSQSIPAIASAAAGDMPTRDSNAAPRVLISLPAISLSKTGVPSPSRAAAKSIVEQAAAHSTSKPIAVAPIETAVSPGNLADAPWYVRLNTPWMQKYLPYATAAMILVCMFVWMRTHTGKSKPVAADPDVRVWNTGAAIPNQHVGGPAPNGSANGQAWPGSKAPAVVAPSAPMNSPSAWQAPSEQVPPMPAHNPALNTPNASDPGVVQGAANGYELRTAANSDPRMIPPGRGAGSQPGVAQFQGGITPPQQ